LDNRFVPGIGKLPVIWGFTLAEVKADLHKSADHRERLADEWERHATEVLSQARSKLTGYLAELGALNSKIQATTQLIAEQEKELVDIGFKRGEVATMREATKARKASYGY
jgi:chromosome condensin MukBEF ATPase and DNA-binding subunit MukB